MATDIEDFDSNDIAQALRKHVESWTPSVERGELGRVMEAGDGIARVSGLPRAMANELLEFPGGILGLAFNLDVAEIGCIILGDSSHIQEGDPVKQTGQILSVPVGDGFLGRVVNALGEPLDDKGPIQSQDRRILEVQAPNVVNRQPVKEPLYTGITAIDAMTAIGRGQRELIIGDRQTGKTAVAIDAIIAQTEHWAGGDPKKRVKCIYVAVGQKSSTVAEVVATLKENGALDYTVVVNAPASDPAPFQYIAPYSGRRVRRALDVQRRARADRLRRPVEAGHRLPDALAAAAPAAGTRGVPGRRLLPALAPAGARREALRRARRRVADGAADHRDQGRRHLRVHPDERHLDHRRADLPRAGPVLRGCAARHQHRHLGLARRRERADQGDEEGGRAPAAGPRAVPRAGGVRPVRLRAGQGVAAAARARRPRGRGPEAAAVRAASRRARGRHDLDRDRRLPRPVPGRGREAVRGGFHLRTWNLGPTSSARSGNRGTCPTRSRRRSRSPSRRSRRRSSRQTPRPAARPAAAPARLPTR